MQKIPIEKNSVQETLIVPLFGRKLCAEQFPKLYQDSYAARICELLDYDFSSLERKKNNLFWQFGGLEAAIREMDMLWEINAYLQQHPRAAVVNLGCGLNMTGRNADNGQCRIYNLDFPEVIQVRDALVPAGVREQNIACNLHDFSWMNEIDGSEGAIFYAAGVFHYFTTAQAKQLTCALAENFPKGRLVFDTVGKLGRDMMMKLVLKNAGIENVSGMFFVDRPDTLKEWSERVRLLSSKSYMRGYYSLKELDIAGIHRLLAMLSDYIPKMRIIVMAFR